MMQNKRIIASILFVLASTICLAQQDPPPPGTPPPPGLPIDGYLFIGICVGVYYGTKKLLKDH